MDTVRGNVGVVGGLKDELSLYLMYKRTPDTSTSVMVELKGLATQVGRS